MELEMYKDSYRESCILSTEKGMTLIFFLSAVFIAFFTVLDSSFFQFNYLFWRGIGLVFSISGLTISLITSLRERINANYLFSLNFVGILVMMEGIFLTTIFSPLAVDTEKMAVTVGIVSVYFIFYVFSLGAKREFFYIVAASLIPILVAIMLNHSPQNYGYLTTILATGITVFFALRRSHVHSQDKFAYSKHLEDNERELKKKQRELERMNEELRSFNHSISHDFKTPIRAVNSFSQLLIRDINLKNYHKINQYVQFISGSMQKMNNLLEALNVVSDISKKHIEFKKVELTPILEDAFSEASFGSTKKYEFHIAEDLPPVSGDESLLREVFSNIFSNALKYSYYQSTVVINVGYYQEGDETIIFIKDNGIGFNMEYKDQLFQMFKRLHNEEEYEGTGIGLAIVKRIMGYHQGEVWASSVQGKGATFYLSFPRYAAECEVIL